MLFDLGPASQQILRCWKLADYGTLPLYQIDTPLLTEKVGRLPALTSIDVVVLQCRAAAHSLGAAARAEPDGIVVLVLRGSVALCRNVPP